MEDLVYSVSQVNTYLKTLMDKDRFLSAIFVRGEISNYKLYPSGHHYFALKDEVGAIRCVLFRREASRLRFRPENGMKVIAFGHVSVFPRDGQYQLYCGELSPDGVGALHLAFEQLKEKLFREGLFDPAQKKPLPPYPKTVALITSPAGAAVRDMIRILGARWPLAKVVLLPVRVQGAEAPAELCGALRFANRWNIADLILIGRGGGSMEDLWAFNDEKLARAIYESKIPVVSAVGHEPDVTIADFVADVRAATPSNAAELAVPDIRELGSRLAAFQRRLGQAMHLRLSMARARLEKQNVGVLQYPMRYMEGKRLLLDFVQQRLDRASRVYLSKERERFSALAASLDALSPLKVLGRGYSIAAKTTGEIIKNGLDVLPGETITLRLQKGGLFCTVERQWKPEQPVTPGAMQKEEQNHGETKAGL
ncbi:MAG: exodeoxyribonuclease VII large subunit [Oscillospiraceae bacterium]|nr:exodeoxyribonuclease VII large subunit [Oscillospiraceae bacterium]